MKAITCRSSGVPRLEEVDEPVEGADEVLVEPATVPFVVQLAST